MIKCERGRTNLQKMQQQTATNILWYGECFMSSTLQASVFMVKKYSDNLHSIQNTEDLTMKQMFRHIWEIDNRTIRRDLWNEYKLTGNTLHGSVYLWLVMRKSSVSCAQRSTYSQILYHVLEGVNENPKSNTAWEDGLKWFTSSRSYRDLDRIDGEPMEIEWENLPRIHHVAAQPQSSRVTAKIERNTRKFTGRNIFMSMFNDISWNLKTLKKNASQVLNSFLTMQRDLEQDNGHSLDLDQRKSGTLLMKKIHKENGTELQSGWCWHWQKAHTQYSDPRVY